MKFLYMLVVWFVITTLLYFMISVYSRSVRREKLEKQWAEDHQGGDRPARAAMFSGARTATGNHFATRANPSSARPSHSG